MCGLHVGGWKDERLNGCMGPPMGHNMTLTEAFADAFGKCMI